MGMWVGEWMDRLVEEEGVSRLFLNCNRMGEVLSSSGGDDDDDDDNEIELRAINFSKTCLKRSELLNFFLSSVGRFF